MCLMNLWGSNTMNTERWVILSYFNRDPVQVYGTFDTESEAHAYAEQQGFATNVGSAYEVKAILDINED